MKFSVFLAGMLLIAAAVADAGFPKSAFRPDESAQFKETEKGGLTLEVFYPGGKKPETGAACIVLFFGGGWNGGGPAQFYPQAAYFASRGMVAICPEYRTKKSHGAPPYECVEDAKAAIRYIRKHAQELGVDPDRIAAGGGSAGGHLAAACGTVEKFNDPKDDLTVSAVPNAMVLFNPVFNNGPGGYGYDRVKEYYEDFSPMHNLSKKVPPTLVLMGAEDKLTSPETCAEYKRLMEAAGNRCDLSMFDGQGHGFFNPGRDPDSICFKQTLVEADRFLQSLGLLPQGECVAQWFQKFDRPEK